MRSWRFSEKSDELEIQADAMLVGEDLLVVLSGGQAHIGAVGLAEPRPSLQDPARISASSSVFTFPAHREDAIAKEMAEELARRLNRRVVVTAGMHWEDLNAGRIGTVVDLCRRLGQVIADEMLRFPGE